MMTVISSVCAMIPLALGEGAGTELYRGMGIALIGGLRVSAIFTIFLVPIFYLSLWTWVTILIKMIL
jgi:hydrophobic/amphiphilic exporter-1 (mainly G- bacteria), HAE1 family